MSSIKPPLSRRAGRAALLALMAVAAASAQAAYQKVSNSGALLPATATLGTGPNDWACTYDDATQLLWEVKTSDGGLRDWQKGYTNYDDPNQPQVWNGDNPATFRNPTPAEINAPTNSIGYQAAVNAQGLCGFNDWRRPTGDSSSSVPADRELQSLFNQTTWDYLDPAYLENPSASDFWSGSPVTGSPGDARGVGRYGGGDWDYVREYPIAVRLVRAGQLFSLLIQTAGSGAGAVTDAAAAVNCTRSATGVTSGVCTSTAPRTLTATPAAGATVSWSGCDSNPTPTTCVVAGNAARTVTATFNAAGAGGNVAAVPTLGEWSVLLLGVLAAGTGAARLRRPRSP